jgi:hypothetical protein
MDSGVKPKVDLVFSCLIWFHGQIRKERHLNYFLYPSWIPAMIKPFYLNDISLMYVFNVSIVRHPSFSQMALLDS